MGRARTDGIDLMHKMLAIAACGFALAACSSSGEMLKTATPTVPLQFESEPAGAEVKTSGGQTCKTPCALAVPAADFVATFALNGYQPQTVNVKMMPPEDPRGDSEVAATTSNLPRFDPSPVYAELVKAPPPRRPAKKSRATRPAPEPQQPQTSAPPPMQPASPPPPASSPWPPATSPIR
jgi:hypothetical protein